MKYVIGILAGFVAMISVGFAQEYVFFYGNGCSHCAKTEQFIRENNIDDIFDISFKEIYFNKTNLTELQEYLVKLKLDSSQIGVPFLVINTTNECSYIIGSTPIVDFFQAKLDMMELLEDENIECNTENCQGLECESQTLEEAKTTTDGNAWIEPEVNLQQYSVQDDMMLESLTGKELSGSSNIAGISSDKQSLSPFNKRKFFAVMVPAALSDSINPCAFAVMLLLLSTILSRHQSRKRTLLSGGLFTLAVFLSYLGMGLGIFSALATTSNTFVLKLVVGIIGVLVGLANLKDVFRYGKVFVMEVPFSRRPKMHELIHKVSSPLGAFLIGLLVSVFLLPCSSGPYFTILGFMSSQSNYLNTRGLFYLIIYNLIFVLPMLIIAILVSFGRASVDKLAKIKHENTKIIHLIVGLLMLGLGIYVLLTM